MEGKLLTNLPSVYAETIETYYYLYYYFFS